MRGEHADNMRLLAKVILRKDIGRGHAAPIERAGGAVDMTPSRDPWVGVAIFPAGTLAYTTPNGSVIVPDLGVAITAAQIYETIWA